MRVSQYEMDRSIIGSGAVHSKESMSERLIDEQLRDVEADLVQSYERLGRRMYKQIIIALLGLFFLLDTVAAAYELTTILTAHKHLDWRKDDLVKELAQLLVECMIAVLWNAVVLFGVVKERFYLLLCATVVQVISLVSNVVTFIQLFNTVTQGWVLLSLVITPICVAEGLLVYTLCQLTRSVYLKNKSLST